MDWRYRFQIFLANNFQAYFLGNLPAIHMAYVDPEDLPLMNDGPQAICYIANWKDLSFSMGKTW